MSKPSQENTTPSAKNMENQYATFNSHTQTIHKHEDPSEFNHLLPPSSPVPSSTPTQNNILTDAEDEQNFWPELRTHEPDHGGGDASSSGREDAFSVIELDDEIDPSIRYGPIITPPFSWRKLLEFTGPGILMSTAFLDPGNIEGDLQAGAIAGNSLLWLLLWSTFMGLLIQLLSARVGVATGKGLAELCREEYPPRARFLLWLMAEVAVIAADIQEVIGTAIAIQILSHGVIPLWASVVVTAVDCFMFLFLENYGMRKLEAALASMVATMGLTFAWMFIDAKPNEKDLLVGVIVPKLSTKTVSQAVGIIGCVITPHNVYLHSALVQSRDIDHTRPSEIQEALNYYTIESTAALIVSFFINLFVTTVFAEGFYGTKEATTVGLENAGKYLEEKYSGGALPILYIWGIGLLAAGQSSTITGTYAGQFIMGGFFDLKVKQWVRSVITRSFAIVPTMIVALVFDTSEAAMDTLNEWLNVLQSMQIPFVLVPLFTMVCKEQVMGVFKIGPALERATWAVFAIVMMINVYVIWDFFIDLASGILFGFLFGLGSIAYVTFIIYLASYDTNLPFMWLNSRIYRRISHIGT